MGIRVHLSDRELLRRTRDGDAEAFASFYRARRGDVLAYLRVRVRATEVAADLMCETFTQALVAIHDHERDLPPVRRAPDLAERRPQAGQQGSRAAAR